MKNTDKTLFSTLEHKRRIESATMDYLGSKKRTGRVLFATREQHPTRTLLFDTGANNDKQKR
ncbi:hypothetical protein ACFL02_02065 [Planctomycetota bacterium]